MIRYRFAMQRLIALSVLIVLLVSTICFQAHLMAKQDIAIKSLETSILSQEKRIKNATDEVTRLEKEIDRLQTEKAISKGAEQKVISRGLPRVSGAFKSYMDCRTITSKASKQWQMQQNAVTNTDGLRMLDGRYMIAMGTYYADEVGAKYRIHLSSGQVIDAIVGDIKSDAHTDENRQYTVSNDSIIEFIVDTEKLSSTTRKLGTISEFNGSIEKIEQVK